MNRKYNKVNDCNQGECRLYPNLPLITVTMNAPLYINPFSGKVQENSPPPLVEIVIKMGMLICTESVKSRLIYKKHKSQIMRTQ